MVSPTCASRRARFLHVGPGWLPTNVWLCRKILHLLRRFAGGTSRTPHDRRACQCPGHVLLPACHRYYVHGERSGSSTCTSTDKRCIQTSTSKSWCNSIGKPYLNRYCYRCCCEDANRKPTK